MIDSDDRTLLREFAEDHSEAAFNAFVQRHVDLVYSVALRSVGGDTHVAEDVTQSVFSELARNARKLQSHASVSGWLYTTTRFIASRARRSSERRNGREMEFGMLNNTESSDGTTTWSDVERVLDDALQDLPQRDREAVLLRFFQNQPFNAIAQIIGATENAARMRVDRALEKLRAALERRGVKTTSAVLSGLIMAHGISTAPAALATSIGAVALLKSASTIAIPQIAFLSMNATKIAVATVALIGTTTGWLMAQRRADRLETEVVDLRSTATAPTQGGWNSDEEALIREELTRLRAQHSELMRLRADVTQLRNELADEKAAAGITPGTAPRARNQRRDEQQNDALHTAIARMGFANAWGIALLHYASENEGRIPASIADAAGFFPRESVAGNSAEEFEIVYQGTLNEIDDPAKTIILREKEPFQVQADGSAQRTYLFADGHAEVHTAKDGNFDNWENQHLFMRSEPRPGGGAAGE